MTHTVLCKLTDSLKTHRYHSILVEEATEISFKEQVRIYIHHVSCDMEIHEDILGLYEMGNTTAGILTKIIKDVVCQCGLDLVDCRGQAYDGVSNMKGRESGVHARLEDKPMMVH